MEARPSSALTQVHELVEAEFSRLMREGVFSFGTAVEGATD